MKQINIYTAGDKKILIDFLNKHLKGYSVFECLGYWESVQELSYKIEIFNTFNLTLTELEVLIVELRLNLKQREIMVLIDNVLYIGDSSRSELKEVL